MRPQRSDVDPHNPDAGKFFKFWFKSFELFLKVLATDCEFKDVTAAKNQKIW